MSDHAHHAAVEDDHPGYNGLANASFALSIPTLYVGGGAAIAGASDGWLTFFAVLAAICMAGGLLGIVWSLFAGRKVGTGIWAIILGALAFTLTVWAASY